MVVKIIKKGEHKGELQKAEFSPLKNELELGSFDLDDFDDSMCLEKREVDFWNKTGYDPRKVWDGFKMFDDYKVHYEIYEGALNHLNEKMKASGKPLIKSINDDYKDGDLVLIKNGAIYSVGAYNGVFMQIVRDDVQVPKSELELELDRARKESLKKIESLDATDVTTKTDREIFLEAQQIKRTKYFKGFKEKYGIPAETTMEVLFAQVEKSDIAFEDYIGEIENAADEAAGEYLDVDDGSY